jgi:predicted ester cyclase
MSMAVVPSPERKSINPDQLTRRYVMPAFRLLQHALSIAVLATTLGTARADGQLPAPQHLTITDGMSRNAADELLLPARRYYAFWQTGDAHFAEQALAKTFTDLNLPAGRPQGPTGPLVASAQFRQAVPDLSVTVDQAFVVGDHVISQLTFTGHFSGRFGNQAGDGRAIKFVAIDNYTIRDGRIQANWHLEDNLTLMQQLGLVARN